MSLKYEPASEPLHISVKYGCHRADRLGLGGGGGAPSRPLSLAARARNVLSLASLSPLSPSLPLPLSLSLSCSPSLAPPLSLSLSLSPHAQFERVTVQTGLDWEVGEAQRSQPSLQFARARHPDACGGLDLTTCDLAPSLSARAETSL